MRGLLRKDFYMARKYCRSTCLVAAVFLAFSVLPLTNEFNMFYALFPLIIINQIVVTLIAYEERCQWTSYVCTLPVSPRQIIGEKYLLNALLVFSTLILSALLYLTLLFSGTLSASDYAVTLIVAFCLTLCGNALTLPFIFRFGVERGRTAYYVSYILSFALLGIIAYFFDTISGAFSVHPIFFLLPLFTLAAFVGSYFLSLRAYAKRSF